MTRPPVDGPPGPSVEQQLRDLFRPPAAADPIPVFGPRPPRFDAATATAALTREERRRLGIAAALLGYVHWAARWVDPAGAVGFEAAEAEALAAIAAVFRFDVFDLPAAGAAPPLPDLAPLGIRACRVCGCTDRIGCPAGCSWVEPDLCSACARRAAGLPPW